MSAIAKQFARLHMDIQGAPKKEPLGKIRYLWNCSRYIYQIYRFGMIIQWIEIWRLEYKRGYF